MHFKLFFKVCFFHGSVSCIRGAYLFIYSFIHHRDVFLVFRLIIDINGPFHLSVYCV